MKKSSVVFLVAASMLIGFIFGRNWKESLEWDLSAALPTWIQFRKDPNFCIAPTETELQLFEHSVSTLEISSKENISSSWLSIGANKFISHGIYREVEKEYIPVCSPQNYFNRVSEAITASKSLNSHVVKYQLTLVGRLKNPSNYIIERIAEIAFSEQPHLSRNKWSNELDLRPLARTVLASFGELSYRYKTQAFTKMSADDSLGGCPRTNV